MIAAQRLAHSLNDELQRERNNSVVAQLLRERDEKDRSYSADLNGSYGDKDLSQLNKSNSFGRFTKPMQAAKRTVLDSDAADDTVDVEMEDLQSQLEVSRAEMDQLHSENGVMASCLEEYMVER